MNSILLNIKDELAEHTLLVAAQNLAWQFYR